MKKITLLLALVFTSSLMFGQVVLSEDFEAGLTLPTGWTNNDIAANVNNEIWTFETGGEAALLTAGNTNVYTSGNCDGNYAAFDSDGYGNNSTAEEAALESPVFDCSSLTSVTLGYSHYFAGNYGGIGYVEVTTDGITWTTVETYSGDGYDGGTINLDVTTELAGATTAQVRFRWTGDWAVAWYVDNVSVYQCTVASPNAVTAAIEPADAATNVEINYGTTVNNLGPFDWTPSSTGDPADSYNLNLGITAAGGDLGTITGFSSGVSINYDWEPNTTYYWSIDAVNCNGVTAGPIWSFTTEACNETAAPSPATAPSPADAATAVPLEAPDSSYSFSWTAASPDDSFTLNLGTTNPPTQSFENFANGGTITGLAVSTTYYWSVDVVNCFGITTATNVWSFTTDATLGIEDNTLQSFGVYPNPTSGLLNIKSSQDVDNVTVFNLLGQSVATFSKNEITNSSIDMSDLSQGLYLVKITSGDNTQTIRVTKD
ncbi:T9SS type A sorting domain-containing protein [Winogradskyella eckloniae]|uniref:T9SS type A sorting domain-containing protein n=1 Tax=Winogradskyella eckloniae TaxID=1089306 RepID=UPI00156554F5|nr:T9SS type A sorting domain-containing protein [Winogradskyella eckloniae]NRD19388.1 T9SS type A sorting domain-containing protein [Winogradskyella eckloniae]